MPRRVMPEQIRKEEFLGVVRVVDDGDDFPECFRRKSGVGMIDHILRRNAEQRRKFIRERLTIHAAFMERKRGLKPANDPGDDWCDISRRPTSGGDQYSPTNADDDGRSLILTYNLKTGSWGNNGLDDDYLGDPNGYGHASGNEDGSTGTSGADDEDDCELWFDITQNDYDDDEVTYWEEINVYNSDPTSSASPGWVGYFIDSRLYDDLLSTTSNFTKYLRRIEHHADRATKCFVVDTAVTDHVQLREILRGKFDEGMRGAVFVGQLPYANYYFGKPFYPVSPIDQYYSQLDWLWFGNNMEGVFESYDERLGEENLRTLWIGQLRPPVSNIQLQKELLEDYFWRGIQYMNLQSPCIEGAFQCDAEDLGTIWSHLENVKYAYSYNVYKQAITNSEFIQILTNYNYEYVHITGHGNPTSTGIGYININKGTFAGNPGRTHFYWLDSCYNGRYSDNDYIAGWFTFYKGSQGLGTIAQTSTSPVLLDITQFYTLFNQEVRVIDGHTYYGTSIGEIISSTFTQNRPLGMTYIGDPLLRSWRV